MIIYQQNLHILNYTVKNLLISKACTQSSLPHYLHKLKIYTRDRKYVPICTSPRLFREPLTNREINSRLNGIRVKFSAKLVFN